MIAIISSTYENTISKPIENTSLLHVQFGRPLKVLANKSVDFINQNIHKHKPEVNTLIVDIKTAKTLTTFDIIAPVSTQPASKQSFVKQIGNIATPNKKTMLSAYWIPYGITIQFFHFESQLIMSTFSNQKMNGATFGGDQTL